MTLLTQELLRQVHEAAVLCGLAGERAALLAALPREIEASLPRAESGATDAQLLMDLQELNRRTDSVDGHLPLQLWLGSAALLARGRGEPAAFQVALQALSGVSLAFRADGIPFVALPTTGALLVGRERELDQLHSLWTESRARIVSIVAWGGVGKSALVRRWLTCLDESPHRPAQIFAWSFYNQGTGQTGESADLFFARALAHFGDPEPEASRDRGRRLARLIADRRVLLVLDGMEPLQHGAGPDQGKLHDPQIRDLLGALAFRNEGLCVITSRFSVRELESHGGPAVRRMDLTTLSPAGGAALLRGLEPPTQGTDAELEEASRAFDGHCLALTLLGAYLASTGSPDIRRRAELGPFQGDTATKVTRMMAHYDAWLQGRPALVLLDAIGLFDRPVAESLLRGLVERVLAWDARGDHTWNEALSTLMQARLVSLSDARGGDRTIDAHPLVRDHFGERFRCRAQALFLAAHAWLYEQFRVAPREERPGTIAGLEPLYAALRHGCLGGLHQRALEEVYWPRILRMDGRDPRASSFRFHSTYRLGAFGSEVTAISYFFEGGGWSAAAPGLTHDAQAFVLMHAGFCLRSLGRIREAVQPMKRALELYQELSLWDRAASTAGALSGACLSLGLLDEALTHANTGVAHADRAGDLLPRAYAWTLVGHVRHQEGHLEEANAAFLQAEDLQRQEAAKFSVFDAMICFRRCLLLSSQGRHEEILRRTAGVLPLAEERRDLLSVGLLMACEARAMTYLAIASASARGDVTFPDAMARVNEAMDWLSRAGMTDGLLFGHLVRAALCREAGRWEEGLADTAVALAMAERDGMALGQADVHVERARLLLAGGDAKAAAESVQAAREIVRRTRYGVREEELALLENACFPPGGTATDER